MDTVRNGYKVRETRLRWFGHVQWRDSKYTGQWMLNMELLDRRKRRRPQRGLIDVVKEDIQTIGVTEEDEGIG